MRAKSENSVVSARVASHRNKLREKGLKPVQMWIADTTHEDVRAALEQACRDIEAYPGSAEDAEFIYALSQDSE